MEASAALVWTTSLNAAHVLLECAFVFLVISDFSLHYLISFFAVMSLQQQDTRHTVSTLRRFSPAFSLVCIVTWSQLNWSPGEDLWERSPCSASQLSAGQRAARRFAWRFIPHCTLKQTVPFRAAAEAVGMQGNISPFPTRPSFIHRFPGSHCMHISSV